MAGGSARSARFPGIGRPAPPSELTTPYPVVVVEPGQDVTLDLDIRSPSRAPVRLAVGQLPNGWRAFLRGGGHRVSAVYAGADTPDVKLHIQVPEGAWKGSHRLVVTGRGPSGTATLPIGLRVVSQASGAYDLTVEFPQLRGPRPTRCGWRRARRPAGT
jgi:uncharacterized membrane protein